MTEANGTITQESATTLLHELQTLAASLLSRTALAERLMGTHGGQRQLWEELGYPAEVRYEDMLARVTRGDIAKRIIWAYPSATWRPPPRLSEDADDSRETPFEAAWQGLVKQHGIWDTLERLDRLAQIGQYAVLLINVRGQGALDTPLQPFRRPDPANLVSLVPYSQRFATIQTLTTDTESENFGKPEIYQLDFSRGLAQAGLGTRLGLQRVHYTRIIHVAQDLLEDEVFGLPRLLPIWNRLIDLDKVVGGSAEMFWLGALRGLVAVMRDGYQWNPAKLEEIRADLDAFTHRLRRWLGVEGVDVQALQNTVASPKDHFDVLLDCIAGESGIPRRMLTGSERGELASTQDKQNWNARVMEYRVTTPETRILRPLVDRLIRFGLLPEPRRPYRVVWPDLQALSEQERSQAAQQWASAITTYTGPGQASSVVPPEEFREIVLGLPAQPPSNPRSLLTQRRRVQRLVFDERYTPERARAWAQAHGFATGEADGR